MLDTRKILKLKHYNNSIQYTYMDINYNSSFSNRSKRKHHSTKDEISRCSISRSISNIKELCFCNTFDFFFTLTLKTNKRNNVLYSTKLINYHIKQYAKTRKDFKYLYVFEKQSKRWNSSSWFF